MDRDDIADVQQRLQGLIDHLRGQAPTLADPQAQCLLECSAEVLTGLTQACRRYLEKAEEAWRH